MKNKPTNPNQKIRNHTYTSYNEEDDQTDCSRQTARCNGYADLPLGCVCEGVEVRNSADIDAKLYKQLKLHQIICKTKTPAYAGAIMYNLIQLFQLIRKVPSSL